MVVFCVRAAMCRFSCHILLITLICQFILINADETYDKCLNAPSGFRGACVNITGFNTTLYIRYNGSMSQMNKLHRLVTPSRPGNVSLAIRVAAIKQDLECSTSSHPGYIMFIILFDGNRTILHVCTDKKTATIVKLPGDSIEEIANCICAHLWSCRSDAVQNGICRLEPNCSCTQNRTKLYTVDIGEPPQFLKGYPQKKCPELDCCKNGSTTLWTEWTKCADEKSVKHRQRVVRTQDYVKICKTDKYAKSCLVRFENTSNLTQNDSDIAAKENVKTSNERFRYKPFIIMAGALMIMGIFILVVAVVILFVLRKKIGRAAKQDVKLKTIRKKKQSKKLKPHKKKRSGKKHQYEVLHKPPQTSTESPDKYKHFGIKSHVSPVSDKKTPSGRSISNKSQEHVKNRILKKHYFMSEDLLKAASPPATTKASCVVDVNLPCSDESAKNFKM